MYVRYVDKKLINVTNGKPMPGPVPSFLGLNGLWMFLRGGIYGLIVKNNHYGPVVRIFVGPFAFIFAMDYDSYSAFYSKKSFHRGILFTALGDLIPGALFITEGQEWRRHRLLMNQFFSEDVFIPLIRDYLEITKEEYEALDYDKVFKIHEWTDKITSRILMKSLFNITVNRKNEQEMKKFEQATHVIEDWWIVMVFVGHMLFPPSTKSIFAQKFIKNRLQPFLNIIQHMKDNPEESGWTQLAQNGEFTWKEFENESIALFLAGYETSSNTLCIIFQLLSRHTDVRKKLKTELDTVLGGRFLTYDDLKNLPYLEKVLLECLRFKPFMKWASRKSVEQDTIGEYVIPKGHQIFSSPTLVIRESVDDPDSFNPDRYNDENIKELSKKILSGFGLGPHTCIGRHLALLELKIITAYLIQNGNLEVDTKEHKPNPHLHYNSSRHLTAVKKRPQSE